jgi:hypothetical protein
MGERVRQFIRDEKPLIFWVVIMLWNGILDSGIDLQLLIA